MDGTPAGLDVLRRFGRPGRGILFVLGLAEGKPKRE